MMADASGAASAEIDYKAMRAADGDAILNSPHPRKVVVAGPGTGKTFLFEEALKRKVKEGKRNFLAITFMGKLGDMLADDLAGLATTMTLHGFARAFLLDTYLKNKSWTYVPDISDIIQADLKARSITDDAVGSKEYFKRSQYYKAIGDNDAVFYAAKVFKKRPELIPIFDLVLIDEFQDFNEVEAELIDLLATKNEIIIVGDDDQALYEFRGTSPDHIRERYDSSNTDYESHTLRFCSRCTSVLVEAFHGVVQHYHLNDAEGERVAKEYLCYLPDKEKDSANNPKIVVVKQEKLGHLPVLIRDELESLLETQKIKTVLVLAEAQTCKKILTYVSRKLKLMGFSNVISKYYSDQAFDFHEHIIEGYKVLSSNPRLGWRLLVDFLDDAQARNTILTTDYENGDEIENVLPTKFVAEAKKNSEVLRKIIYKADSEADAIADSSIERLKTHIVESERQSREILIRELKASSHFLPRPLGNLEITVASILGSKGLGADVVFLIGFDKKKFPASSQPQMSEIYQLLVTLTRAKKRVYLVNSYQCAISEFIDSFPAHALTEKS